MNADDLNILYEASIEWGKHYDRDLEEWSKELFPKMSTEARAEIAAYIGTVKEEIYDYIWKNYTFDEVNTNGNQVQAGVKEWIRSGYPWMNEENIANVTNKGMYWVWKG